MNHAESQAVLIGLVGIIAFLMFACVELDEISSRLRRLSKIISDQKEVK